MDNRKFTFIDSESNWCKKVEHTKNNIQEGGMTPEHLCLSFRSVEHPSYEFLIIFTKEIVANHFHNHDISEDWTDEEKLKAKRAVIKAVNEIDWAFFETILVKMQEGNAETLSSDETLYMKLTEEDLEGKDYRNQGEKSVILL